VAGAIGRGLKDISKRSLRGSVRAGRVLSLKVSQDLVQGRGKEVSVKHELKEETL